MADVLSRVQLQLEPAWEPAFWAAVAAMQANPSILDEAPPLLQALAKGIQIDAAKAEALHAHAQNALEHAQNKLIRIYAFLHDSRVLADVYSEIARASLDDFLASPFAQKLRICLQDWDLFQSLAGWEPGPELMLLLVDMQRTLPHTTQHDSLEAFGQHMQEVLGIAGQVDAQLIGVDVLNKATLTEAGALQLPVSENNENRVNHVVFYHEVSTGNWEQLNLLTFQGEPSRLLLYWPDAACAMILVLPATCTLIKPVSILDGKIVRGEDCTHHTFHIPIPRTYEDLFREATPEELAAWKARKALLHLFTWKQDNKREKLVLLDHLVLQMTMLLSLHYTETAEHSNKVLMGYICSLYGLLQAEDEYLDTDTRTTYREYLRNKINNSFQRLKV